MKKFSLLIKLIMNKINRVFIYFHSKYLRLLVYLFGDPMLSKDEDIEEIVNDIKNYKKK